MQTISPKTLFVGQSAIFLESISSTNDFLKELVSGGGVLEGTLVTTNYQLNGKGQKGNTWRSNAGENALFSIYFVPKFLNSSELNVLSFVIALGVRAAVQQLLPKSKVKLKWPNDIFADDCKIGGVLIENSLGEESKSIVGIGVNVNQSQFNELTRATSIRRIKREKMEVASVINSCCEFIEKYYLLAKQANGVQQIHHLYVSQLYRMDEFIKIDSENWQVKGVDLSGKLDVTRKGVRRKLVHNETDIGWS